MKGTFFLALIPVPGAPHRGVVAAAVSAGSMRPRQLVWLLLLVLVGAIVAIERTDFLGSQSDGDGDREVRMLLPVPVDELGAVEITHAGAVYRFERDEMGAW